MGTLSRDVFEPRTLTGGLCSCFQHVFMPDQWVIKLSFQHLQLDFLNERVKYASKRRSLDFRSTYVAQKRLFLSSLIFYRITGENLQSMYSPQFSLLARLARFSNVPLPPFWFGNPNLSLMVYERCKSAESLYLYFTGGILLNWKARGLNVLADIFLNFLSCFLGLLPLYLVGFERCQF